MIKFFYFFTLFFFIISCSIDNKSRIWSKNNNTKTNDKFESIIFEDNKILSQEFNANIKIILKDKFTLDNKKDFYKNNLGIKNYDGILNEEKKIKFSTIKNFKKYKPDLIFSDNGNIYFYDKQGTIIKYSKDLKILWKKNIYEKKEKKMNPILNFATSENILIVTDTLSNYYTLDALSGNLLWKKKNVAAFNSEIKNSKNKFFTVDFDNNLKCFSIKSGKLLWEYKTENTLIKSIKKTSVVLKENKIIFLSITGDLNALDLNGNLVWQTPTSNSIIFEDSFTNKYSDIVLNNNSVYFSNNKNEFFSISSDTGSIRWRKKINSSIRPIITNDLVITITDNGYLIILEKKSGKLIRSTNVKKNYKKKNWDKLENNGFVIGKNKIYLSSNGKLNIIELIDGLSKKIINIDKKFITRPHVFDKSMYIVSNNSIIKYN